MEFDNIAYKSENLIQKQASNPNHNIFVAASAGSGKTKILIDRIIRLLLSGVKIESILCITLTKNAAEEIISRLAKIMERWLYLEEEIFNKEILAITGNNNNITLRDARLLYLNFIKNESKLNISTIHSFAQKIINKFKIESGLFSSPNIIDNINNNKIFNIAKEKLLTEINDKNLPNNNLLIDLKSLTNHINIDRIFKLIFSLIEKREKLFPLKNFSFTTDLIIERIYDIFHLDKNLNQESIINIKSNNININNILYIAEFLSEKDRLIINNYLNNNYDLKLFNQYRNIFLTKELQIRKTKKIKKNIIKENLQLNKLLEEEELRLINISNKLLKINLLKNSKIILYLYERLFHIYQLEKNKRNYLDYKDLIEKIILLFSTNEDRYFILYKLDQEINHILVDEAQDTNHMQWNIIKLITDDFFNIEENKTIFIVGDEKQSIYSFQDADNNIFLDIFNYFTDKTKYNYNDNGENNKIKNINLYSSFRSGSNILLLINKIFANKKYQNAITKLNFYNHRNILNIKANVILHDLLDMEGDDKDNNLNIYCKLIASKINHIIRNEKIFLKKYNRYAKFSDITIIIRKRTNNIAKIITQELIKYNISSKENNNIILNENILIADILNLLYFLHNNYDDYHLIKLLQSKLLIELNINDLYILNLRKKHNNSYIFTEIKNSKNKKIQSLFLLLEDIKKIYQDNYISISSLLSKLIEYNIINKNIINNYNNTDKRIYKIFIELIEKYQKINNIYFLNEFLEIINNNKIELNKKLLAIANLNEDDKVNIKTIHAAKGNESPIVFLVDTIYKYYSNFDNDNLLFLEDDKLNSNYPLITINSKDKYIDIINNIKSQNKSKLYEEDLRLLYVAITRAEEYLYIFGLKNKNVKYCQYQIIYDILSQIGIKEQENINQYLNENDSKDIRNKIYNIYKLN